jgi:hypothetical protein
MCDYKFEGESSHCRALNLWKSLQCSPLFALIRGSTEFEEDIVIERETSIPEENRPAYSWSASYPVRL